MINDTTKMVEHPCDTLKTDVPLIPFHDFNEATAYAVYTFVKRFVGPTSNDIDKKIEEALVQVRNHLIHAINNEVESLKIKVNYLEKRIRDLENENSRLRVENLLLNNQTRL